jgi:CMP-N-acetylneuraminic acid synthetase
MKISALIPARAMSKRLPGKNFKRLGGIPLIDWTIRAAIEAEVFDRVIVSTDSPEIRSHSLGQGCFPFPLRPTALAGDDVSSFRVVTHCLDLLRENQASLPEMLMLLQPTSPYRNSFRIREAVAISSAEKDAELVSVGPVWKPGSWNCNLHGNRLIKVSSSATWTLNGAIYLLNVERMLKTGELFPPEPVALRMENWESIDIDNNLDWLLAESLVDTVIHQKSRIGRLAEMLAEAEE